MMYGPRDQDLTLRNGFPPDAFPPLFLLAYVSAYISSPLFSF